MDSVIFAATLKKRRVEAGLSQQALAQIAGLSLNTVSRLESGRQYPAARTVRDLAFALECTTEDLTGEPDLLHRQRHLVPLTERPPHRPRGRPRKRPLAEAAASR